MTVIETATNKLEKLTQNDIGFRDVRPAITDILQAVGVLNTRRWKDSRSFSENKTVTPVCNDIGVRDAHLSPETFKSGKDGQISIDFYQNSDNFSEVNDKLESWLFKSRLRKA